MNPPFKELPRVVAKLQAQGGHAVILAPSWSAANKDLRTICLRRSQLPMGVPLFRARGASLLPATQWLTFAYYVCKPPPSGGPALDLPTVVQNAASLLPPPPLPYVWDLDLPPRSSWKQWNRDGIRTALLVFASRPFAFYNQALWDPSLPPPFLCPSCRADHWPWDCSSLLPTPIQVPMAQPLVYPVFQVRSRETYRSDPTLPPVMKKPRVSLFSPPSWGRGASLLSHGDVESNPGPISPLQGRGSLLTCGDIESNPGPGPGKRSLPPDVGTDVDLAHPLTLLGTDPATITAPEGHIVDLRHLSGASSSISLGSMVAPTHITAVLRCRAFMVRHLPTRTLRDFTSCLTWAIDRYCQSPSDDSLFGILALPKLCLRPVATKGKFALTELELAILRRLELFRTGHWDVLWAEFQRESFSQHSVVETRASKKARTITDVTDSRTLRRVRTLLAEGAAAKAVQTLSYEGVHQADDPRILDALRALHPVGTPVDPHTIPQKVDPFPPSAVIHWEDLVKDAIARFPRTSAGGPSGLRPCHLQECTRKPGHGAALISALSRLTCLWANGNLPAHHSGSWCGANLIPLVKKDTGVRPIAVGDTLRRLVGKVLLATSHAKEQVDSLRPLQVGVGVKKAAESVAMGMQALASALDAGSQWVVLQVDFKNAFNTVDRTTLLRAAAQRAPSSFNYLCYAYGSPAPLFVGDTIILSQAGTHQGCPLGPLGFALGLQDVAERIAKDAGLLWSAWYKDDGLLV